MRSRSGPDRENELRTLLLDIVTRTAADVVFLERAFEHARKTTDLSEPRVAFDAPVADLIETPMDSSDNRDGMLGRLTDAVSESRQAREVIQSLLDGSVGSATVDEP